LVTPAAGHNFVRSDGDDNKGGWDLRSVTVEHLRHDLVYTFKTYESWKADSRLGKATFLIAIDHKGDGSPDRCAFIYHYGGLRGALTNCGDRLIGTLKVSKPSGTTAKLVLSGYNDDNYHYWFAASYWKDRERCPRGCTDYAPNKAWLFHDLVDPKTQWTTGPGVTSATTPGLTMPVSFTAIDEGVGVESWKIVRGVRDGSSTKWVTIDSGSGGGSSLGTSR